MSIPGATIGVIASILLTIIGIIAKG